MIAPLVPPEVDLRDFPSMMIDIARLFGSGFNACPNDAAWRAGVTLWLKSFHQVPAASIPADEAEQAMLAELGRDVKTWRKIKPLALRGWVECSDGRFYHPVVAEKALEAWIERLGQRKSSAAGNAKRYGQTFDPNPFDHAIEASIVLLRALNPNSRMLSKRFPHPSQPSPVGSPDHHPDGLPSGSQAKLSQAKPSDLANPPSSDPPPQEGEEIFQKIWKALPRDEHASQPRARQAFFALPPDDWPRAASGAAAFAEARRRKPTTHPMTPERFLRDRIFDNFAPEATGPPKFKVSRDSPQGRAWIEEGLERGYRIPWSNGHWYFDSEWPAKKVAAE